MGVDREMTVPASYRFVDTTKAPSYVWWLNIVEVAVCLVAIVGVSVATALLINSSSGDVVTLHPPPPPITPSSILALPSISGPVMVRSPSSTPRVGAALSTRARGFGAPQYVTPTLYQATIHQLELCKLRDATDMGFSWDSVDSRLDTCVILCNETQGMVTLSAAGSTVCTPTILPRAYILNYQGSHTVLRVTVDRQILLKGCCAPTTPATICTDGNNSALPSKDQLPYAGYTSIGSTPQPTTVRDIYRTLTGCTDPVCSPDTMATVSVGVNDTNADISVEGVLGLSYSSDMERVAVVFPIEGTLDFVHGINIVWSIENSMLFYGPESTSCSNKSFVEPSFPSLRIGRTKILFEDRSILWDDFYNWGHQYNSSAGCSTDTMFDGVQSIYSESAQSLLLDKLDSGWCGGNLSSCFRSVESVAGTPDLNLSLWCYNEYSKVVVRLGAVDEELVEDTFGYNWDPGLPMVFIYKVVKQGNLTRLDMVHVFVTDQNVTTKSDYD